MDFEFSEEQEMLRKFARDFLEDNCPSEYVKQMESDETGYSAEVWNGMAELGWMGLAFPEEFGGQEMNFFDLTVLLEEMGRACVPGPFFADVILGGMTILSAGTEEQKKEFLPQIADGKLIMTLALTEPSEVYTPDGIETKAVADGDDYVLNGTKLYVTDFNVADYVICVARTKDGTDADGITLFLVDAKANGVSSTALQGIAADKIFEVVFADVRVPKANIVGQLDKGWDEVEKIMARAAVGKCAEMVGGAQKVLEMSVEYAKDREQFGKPIGSFQAIQHHCANILIDVEGSKNITAQAAWRLTEGLPCDNEIALAKAFVSQAYQRVVTLAHQIHGAIGFTLDHDLPLYYRRAKAAELAFGDTTFHEETVAAEMGL